MPMQWTLDKDYRLRTGVAAGSRGVNPPGSYHRLTANASQVAELLKQPQRLRLAQLRHSMLPSSGSFGRGRKAMPEVQVAFNTLVEPPPPVVSALGVMLAQKHKVKETKGVPHLADASIHLKLAVEPTPFWGTGGNPTASTGESTSGSGAVGRFTLY
ncbi:hypothetical protein EYF80_043392 [Liparis tanakae]|uniref:Uncharacterized protein n=1 Tax=Liparis tanakae TaxID=230148 RepID=A0A4Z2G0H4_9TELE|nr:hypothetical protein EYF80_043392 [Liparis tanakae]